MIKTTNYEISKKLLKIGFEAETDFFWHRDINLNISFRYYPEEIIELDYDEDVFSAYDLETILDALPCGLDRGDERYNLKMLPNISISYTNKFFNHIYDYRDDYCCENGEVMACISKNKETMVDMAGRLLIKLFENDLIKFKE